MFGEIKKVAMTNIVNLTSSQTNIDIGLLENKNFDFSINQTIQKVTVSNKKGTKEYTYDNKKLAKVKKVGKNKYKITANNKKGKVKITVTLASKKKATCQITVK